jgi:integration host factor subunit alpha
MTITKDSIIKKISDNTGFSTQTATTIVDKIIEEMKESLHNGHDILISGFGKFMVYSKHSRKGRNPKTHTTIVIRSRKVVTFRTSTTLRKKLNEYEE